MKIRNKTTYLSKPTSIGLFRPIASHINDSDANICSSTEDNNVNTIHAIWSLIKINSVSFMPFLSNAGCEGWHPRNNAPIYSIQTKDQISQKKKNKTKKIYEQKWIQQV